MKNPSAVIAEDELHLRTSIRRMLEQLWPDLIICAEAADGIEAVQAIERFSPDIVFLDIQMPGLDGLSVAEQVGGRTHVVFITAYDQHTLSAFEHGAVDYLLKPVSTERIQKTITRLRERIQSAPADMRSLIELIEEARQGGTRYLKWLTVGRASEMKLLTVSDICYLRADNKYTNLVTAEGQFLLTMLLKEMKTKLDPDNFWQVHRSVIVNVSAIQTVYRSFRGSLELKLKERPELLPVSAAYAHLFRQL